MRVREGQEEHERTASELCTPVGWLSVYTKPLPPASHTSCEVPFADRMALNMFPHLHALAEIQFCHERFVFAKCSVVLCSVDLALARRLPRRHACSLPVCDFPRPLVSASIDCAAVSQRVSCPTQKI